MGFVRDEASPAGFAVVGCGFGRGGGGEVEGYIEAGEGVVELVGLHGDGIRRHVGVGGQKLIVCVEWLLGLGGILGLLWMGMSLDLKVFISMGSISGGNFMLRLSVKLR